LGCSEEDIFETTEAQEINGIISQFSPETFGKVVSGDYKVNWDVSATLEHSEELGADYYEFEISLPENQIQITSKLYDIKQSLLAVKKENGQYDFYVAKYFMDRWKAEGYSVKDVSLSKMGSFSGLLNVFNNIVGSLQLSRLHMTGVTQLVALESLGSFKIIMVHIHFIREELIELHKGLMSWLERKKHLMELITFGRVSKTALLIM
tara:strand:- start:1295 stop:1915 length:621 start_codon:yes stop_codon:yes gene_type:complete